MMAKQPISDVETVLHQYDDRFLECRSGQHDWTRLGMFQMQEGLIAVREHCRRCGGQVTKYWGSDGARYASRYMMPDGYSIRGLFVSKADLRMETMKRYSAAGAIFGSEDQMLKAAQVTRSAQVTRRGNRR